MEPENGTDAKLSLDKHQVLLDELGSDEPGNKGFRFSEKVFANDLVRGFRTFFIIQIQVNDLALFFLKYIYQVPTHNWMIMFRTFLVGFLCVNAAK
jgi:hypothetical protein